MSRLNRIPQPLSPAAAAALRDRILTHLLQPNVPADTASWMAQLFGVSRFALERVLAQMLEAGEVMPGEIGSLTIYRHHARAGSSNQPVDQPQLAVQLIRCISGASRTISSSTAWAKVTGKPWGDEARRIYAQMEARGLLMATQYGYAITPFSLRWAAEQEQKESA